MTEELIAKAVEGGIWVLLAVALMLYILDDTKRREQKYQEVIKANQEIIREMTSQLNVVTDIKSSVDSIKEKLKRG